MRFLQALCLAIPLSFARPSPGQSGKPAVLDDALDEKMPR